MTDPDSPPIVGATVLGQQLQRHDKSFERGARLVA